MAQADCGQQGPAAASAWVGRFLGGVRPGGRVLDVACGSGRHLRLAREAGLLATGIDRDLSRVGDLRADTGCELLEADLETGAPEIFEGRRFDGVIVTNYLWRPILPAIVGSVASDGILLYETFAVGQERIGRPKNAEFLLQPGELIEVVRGVLTVIAYEHVELCAPARRVQRIAAVGPLHSWIREPIRLNESG